MQHFGPVYTETWARNPERMCFGSTRYKFVGRLLDGYAHVAEIGAADGTLSRIVATHVGVLDLYDLAPAADHVRPHDIVQAKVPRLGGYDAVYMIDVLEHIHPADEASAIHHIKQSMHPNGVFIAGVPSVQAQRFANDWSKVGHVNVRDGRALKAVMQAFFSNVFLFTMNDEQIGTGNGDMAYYLFVLCCGPK